MGFFARQRDEVNPLVEISFTPSFTPGAVANGATVATSQACTLGNTTVAATFNLGDIMDIFPPASAALNGLHCSVFPTATAGTAQIYFINSTGGSITPVAAKYLIVATRIQPTLVS